MKTLLRGTVVAVFLILVASPGPPVIAQDDGEDLIGSIRWETGPTTGRLGDIGEILIPEGYIFASADDTQTFLEALQNPTSGEELGLIVPITDEEEMPWFVVFEFNPVGYVKDDEKDDLDADSLLSSIRDGNDAANEAREERGWGTVDILGWETSPYYDMETNNLTWAIRGAAQEEPVVNHSTRLLGRQGYMNVDLVLSPSQLTTALPRFERLLEGFSYVEGQRYAEFRKGDRIAAYGLTALVAGGVGAVAAKSGLLGKFWKLIAAAVIGVATFFKKIFRRIFGRGDTIPQEYNAPS